MYIVRILCMYIRDGARFKNMSGQVVMRRAATAQLRLLFCQNLGEREPTLPTRFHHPCALLIQCK